VLSSIAEMVLVYPMLRVNSKPSLRTDQRQVLLYLHAAVVE
jgi:hypothetical protein